MTYQTNLMIQTDVMIEDRSNWMGVRRGGSPQVAEGSQRVAKLTNREDDWADPSRSNNMPLEAYILLQNGVESSA